MLRKPQSIRTIYLSLVFGNTLATSFIWGINTIFLLDAGLSNFEAFAANGLFSLGMVLFEVPTGIIADTYGRRVSYLLGTITLSFSTLLYLGMWQIHGPFWGWAVSSMLLGLGYTFFSGALEAWLVDALHATHFKGNLESVFSKGQIVAGIAMLVGSVSGGMIAQFTNLGVPYVLRAIILLLDFATAYLLMKDLGFTPRKPKQPLLEMKNIFNKSVQYGLKNPPVKWLMFSAPFMTGVSYYIFFALQPYLLELYGNEKAYGIAGLVAALAAMAQIMGGLTAPHLRKLFKKRTDMLLQGVFLTGLLLLLVSLESNFWIALLLIFVWALLLAALTPVRQAYLNGLIPSEQRATVLSFDSLIGSSGSILIQPSLGKAADVWGYAPSYAIAACLQFVALPFISLAKKQNAKSDAIISSDQV